MFLEEENIKNTNGKADRNLIKVGGCLIPAKHERAAKVWDIGLRNFVVMAQGISEK